MQRCRFDHATRAHEPPLRRHRGDRVRRRPLLGRGQRHRARQPPGRARGPLLLRSGRRQRRPRPRRRGGGPRRHRAPVRALHPRADRPRRGADADRGGHHAPRDGAAGGRLLRLPRPRPLDGRRHGHQRQDDRDPAAGRPAQCDRASDQRDGDAVGHTDDARGDRGAAGPGRGARPPEVRRPSSRGGDGGVEPRAGAVARRGHPLRRGRLHQPQPRPSRLPRVDGGVLRGEGDALHAESRAARCRPRRRCLGATAPRARPHPDRRRAPRRRHRRRAASRALRVHLARAAHQHAAHRCHQRRQRARWRPRPRSPSRNWDSDPRRSDAPWPT